MSSAAECLKYSHHSANTSSSPAAAAVAAMTSPSTMMVNPPYRSMMWPGCQGVGRPPNSAQAGTASSAATSTKNPAGWATAGKKSQPIQHSWTTVTPAAYRSVPARPSG
jgi:hypothetical protein